MENRGDTFYVKKEKGYTAALMTTAIVLTAANVAADVYINKNNKNDY